MHSWGFKTCKFCIWAYQGTVNPNQTMIFEPFRYHGWEESRHNYICSIFCSHWARLLTFWAWIASSHAPSKIKQWEMENEKKDNFFLSIPWTVFWSLPPHSFLMIFIPKIWISKNVLNPPPNIEVTEMFKRGNIIKYTLLTLLKSAI